MQTVCKSPLHMVCHFNRDASPEQTALERQNLPCTYLAHHEPESIIFVIIAIDTHGMLLLHNVFSSTTY